MRLPNQYGLRVEVKSSEGREAVQQAAEKRFGICHSEPVRSSAANGPERSEGAQGKLREESRSENKGLRDSSSPGLLGMTAWTRAFFCSLLDQVS